MIIAGLQKSSLIDYPNEIAAVVFTSGCNFRCPFCHNGGLLEDEKSQKMTPEEVLDFLKTRQNKLQGVVISGGEPTLHKDLEDFIIKIRDLGFKIKLDTNGSNPSVLIDLVNKKLIDYVAMDIKSPLKKYKEATNSNIDTEKIKESIDFLLKGKVDYEFRTTVVKESLSFDDFRIIAQEIKGAKRYFLQKFISEHAFDETFRDKTTYTKEEFEKIKEILSASIKEIYVR